MNITMSPQQPMLSVTKAIPFQSGIFADVWRVTQERYYQVKKVCRSALINPALICLEQFGVSFSKQTLTIANAGDQKDTQFVITPPLFSMQGKKENTLRIINATNHQLPGDRESLFWVNVKAIPAMEKDQKNENTLQLAIISRIKMFYRPTNLAMAPEEAPAMLRFRRSGSKLTLINPTPYFITVTNMKAGNSNLPNTMVPPKGEVSVDITHAATGDISFQTINDYGALTPRIKATMQ